MNRKTFKYENKNSKKIRVKDILMLLSVFVLCVITVISTGKTIEPDKKASGQTETLQIEAENQDAANDKEIKAAKLNDYNNDTNSSYEISYEIKLPLDFVSPVNGAITKPFTPNELVYNKTMDDWRTHVGIDIAAPYGSDVVSSEKGNVIKVHYDINYGNTVTIEHGEYTFIYTSLSSDIYVNEGDKVSKGDVIGKTADSCMVEICDEPHIHLEVLKNDEYINPLDIIKFE